MRSFIVGTAGHIDHGKSALVKALTGTDPDRLKEEKERGITIDLGFAHVEIDPGLVCSFIDVPGHERFVRNMLAGAHGIDAVVLVVAADESVMPQTREHFHICRLLDIPRGLVALTKCDAADAQSQALAEMEVRELVAGSFLQGRPVVRVSARTGLGLPSLKAELRALAAEAAPRPAEGLLRLPVDRVFTLKGFGTVVTGTVVAGRLRVGEEIEVLPGSRRARVRGLHTHGRPVEEAVAGSRAAVNLAGLEVDEVERGDVLAHPGMLRPTSMVDALLTLLPDERPLKDQTRVRVHVASAEVLARVRLLGAAEIAPGAPGAAQLRLERPAVAGWHDRLIVRSYSPPRTIGGALVVDPLPPRRRKGASLPAAGSTSATEAAAAMIAEAGGKGIDGPTLAARVALPPPRLAAELGSVGEVEALGPPPLVFLSREALFALERTAVERLERFHRQNPLKAAMPREELRRQAFARSPDAVTARVLDSLGRAGQVRLLPDAVALSRHAVQLSPAEEQASQALLGEALTAGWDGVEAQEVARRTGQDQRLIERVSRPLVEGRVLERVGERLVHRERLQALKDEVRRRWPPGSRLDVGAVKDLTGLSRKFVIPLLEYLDREKVTRRSGAERVVLALGEGGGRG